MTDPTIFVPPWLPIHDACQAFIDAYRTDNEDGDRLREAITGLRTALLPADDDTRARIDQLSSMLRAMARRSVWRLLGWGEAEDACDEARIVASLKPPIEAP